MKKITLALFAMLALTSCFAQKKKVQKNTVIASQPTYGKPIGSALPAFTIETFDGKMLDEKILQNGHSSVVVLFNPTCDHCQHLAKDISKNIALFEKVNIVFIAAKDMKPYLQTFITETGLKAAPAVVVGADRSDIINTLFEFKSLPQTNIYNEENKMVWKKNGEVTAKEILLYTK